MEGVMPREVKLCTQGLLVHLNAFLVHRFYGKAQRYNLLYIVVWRERADMKLINIHIRH
jgi:hypothetical protein